MAKEFCKYIGSVHLRKAIQAQDVRLTRKREDEIVDPKTQQHKRPEYDVLSEDNDDDYNDVDLVIEELIEYHCWEPDKHLIVLDRIRRDFQKYRILPNDVNMTFFGPLMIGSPFKKSKLCVLLEITTTSVYRLFDARLWFRAVPIFQNVVYVPNTWTPVIKAHHIETGIRVEISMSSKRCLIQSTFFRDVARLCLRAEYFLFVLRLWGKLHQERFYEDAIIALATKFLQARSLLPTEQKIDILQFKQWPKDVKVRSLIKEFFKFYRENPHKRFERDQHLFDDAYRICEESLNSTNAAFYKKLLGPNCLPK